MNINGNKMDWFTGNALMNKVFIQTKRNGAAVKPLNRPERINKQNTFEVTYDKGIIINSKNYTSKGTLVGKNSAKEVIEAMNQSADKGFEFWVEGDTFHLGNGMSCSTKELQAALGKNSARELSVTDNRVTFDNNSYYKFTGGDGKEHSVVSLAGTLTAGGGAWDKEAGDYANFWNCMAQKDPTFISMSYSNEEIRSRLAEAGIQTGFFSVSVGGKEVTQFLSQGKNSVAVHSKAQYDNYYNHITSESFLREFEVGHKFTIAGKEYTLGTDKKLDIAYGEDVFDFQTKAPGK